MFFQMLVLHLKSDRKCNAHMLRSMREERTNVPGAQGTIRDSAPPPPALRPLLLSLQLGFFKLF